MYPFLKTELSKQRCFFVLQLKVSVREFIVAVNQVLM